MLLRESPLGYWTSRRSFLWVAAGLALGVGNILRLPLLMLEHGGGAFLLVHLLALLVMGTPLLIAEWALGRWMRADVVSGFASLAQEFGLGWWWTRLGVLVLLASVLLLSFYSVIAGWSLGYLFRAAAQSLAGDAAHASATFAGVVRDPERALAWHTVFMVVVCASVAQGFRQGIERAAAYLLPGAILLLLGLLALILSPQAGRDQLELLLPRLFGLRWHELDWRAWALAFQHAFYTLGLGFGAMMVLGSYLPAQSSLLRKAAIVCGIDLGFSVLAGIAVLVMLAQQQLLPASSPMTVIFEQLPQSLPTGYRGMALGVLFYLMFFTALLGAAMVLLELPSRYLIERFRMTRVYAVAMSAMLVWYLGLGSLLSLSVLADFTVFGQTFFEWAQWWSVSLIAPLSGLLLATLIDALGAAAVLRALWGERLAFLAPLWGLLLAYPARLALLLLLVYALGGIDWLARLWA